MHALFTSPGRTFATWGAALLLSVLAPNVANAAVIFVDADAPGGGDGTSWATAFNDLQDGLAVAQAGDEIWVAEAVYTPDRGTGDRDATFQLVDSVLLLGGFAGDETNRDQRDWVNRITVLSGDLLDDDFEKNGGPTDNSRRIVTGLSVSSATVISGFVLRATYAPNANGGAIYLENSSPLIADCIFADNLSIRGAGVDCSNNDAPLIIRCQFINNAAPIDRGGAIACVNNGYVVIADCYFEGNSSRVGGALSASGASAAIVNSVFVGNTAGNGGGASIVGATEAHIVNCSFFANVADESSGNGGGTLLASNTNCSVQNSVFSGNHAGRAGGGIYIQGDVAIVLCSVGGNTTDTIEAGGIHIERGVVSLTNSAVAKNSNVNGMSERANVFLTNGTLDAQYSCVEGWTGGGVGMLSSDPDFVDLDGADDIVGTLDDDLSLADGSPCTDAGNNAAIPPDTFDLDLDNDTSEPLPVDLLGNPRRYDDAGVTDTGNGTAPLVDMGGFERQTDSPGERRYTGPDGGTWFDPNNWQGRQIPDAQTNVAIPARVVVDQTGAEARDVRVVSGGVLEIGAGSLAVRDLTVFVGGGLELNDASASLQLSRIVLHDGSNFQWLAGTLEIFTGPGVFPDPLVIGTSGAAELILHPTVNLTSPIVEVMPTAAMRGTAIIQGDVLNRGVVAPGLSPGSLTIEGFYQQTTSGELRIEVGGYQSGTEYDALLARRGASIAGTLDVTALQGFQPQLFEVVEFITTPFETISGTWDTVNLPGLDGDFAFFLREYVAAHSLLTIAESVGGRLYVDPDAPPDGDGSSWATALNHFEDALTYIRKRISPIAEVWVAEGVYLPTLRRDPGDERSSRFTLRRDVHFYGGFDGTESDPSQRDIAAHPSVLSGDVGKPGDATDNSFLVVAAIDLINTTVLDGFIIRDGYAIGGSADRGAGLKCSSSIFIVRNCAFENNHAQFQGGAVYGDGDLIFENCNFNNNSAIDREGGAIYMRSGRLDLVNCRFEQNRATFGGSAVFGSPVATDCVFINNEGLAVIFGGDTIFTRCHVEGHQQGAFFTNGVDSLVVDQCTFRDNSTAGYGAALYIRGANSVLITNSVFLRNHADIDGGAVRLGTNGVFDCTVVNSTFSGNSALRGGALWGSANIAITDCIFGDNVAEEGGGLVLTRIEPPAVLTRVSFADNISTGHGGGVCIDGVQTTFIECAFERNSANDNGGGLYAIGRESFPSHLSLINCTFADNSAGADEGIGSGGGAYIVNLQRDFGTVEFEGGLFQNNSAFERGGGMSSQTNLAFNGTTFGGNTASDGSGIYHSFARITGEVVLTDGDDLVNAGFLSPGFDANGPRFGTFSVGGDFREDPGITRRSLVEIDIAGVDPGVDQDIVDVTGVAEILGGGLIARFIDGFVPAAGDEFTVISSAGVQGQFDVISLDGLPDGFFATIDETVGITIRINEFLGSIGFADPQNEEIPRTPTDAVLGDFDQDGDLDIALTIPGENQNDPGSVFVLLNAGLDENGNWLGFGGHTETAVRVQPAGLAVGLFDGDAYPDLAVVNQGDDTLSILLNNATGDATFTVAATIATDAIPVDVTTGDLGGDSDIDLAVTSQTERRIQFFTNDGTGAFTPGSTVDVSVNPMQSLLRDVDNDSDLDLLTINQGDGTGQNPPFLTVSLQTGGSFEPRVSYTVGDGPVEFIAADLNLDSYCDVITVNRTERTASVLVNGADGTGAFGAAVDVFVGDDASSLTAIDLELDGDPDLAFAAMNDQGQRVIRVIRNDFDGEHLILATASDLTTGGDPIIVRAGDVNGDSVIDLIAVNQVSGGPGPQGASVAGLINRSIPANAAELTDITMIDGVQIAGGLPELRQSDDQHFVTEAMVTGEVHQPHLLRMLIGASTDRLLASTMDVTIEARISDVEATVWIFLRDWNTGEMVQIDQFMLGLQESIHRVTVEGAGRFVRIDGRIEMEIKKIVFFPFTLGGFNSFLDLVQIQVQ